MIDEKWNDSGFPLAYLITFRTYGSWLHGDERGSVDTHGKNIYGTAGILPNRKLEDEMRENLSQDVLLLDRRQRESVEAAIREICEQRGYFLQALNVRSNHVHAVISSPMKPERIADALKAFSTKKLREKSLVKTDEKIWSRGRSRRYLWKPRHIALAIEYVLYGQGDTPFDLEEAEKEETETRTQ
ncbi:MAG: transposase [Pyrinomonadaceae bacterium]